MTLLRALARPMLASFFVLNGVKAVRNPDPLVPAAEPIADKIVPLAKKVAPEPVGEMIPTDVATLVRINGVLQVAGGLALATGKGRRLGALLLAGSIIPTTLAEHPFWKRTDPDQKAQDKLHFLKNVGLLGGVLIASADTEGKPSLAWRANATTKSAAKKGKAVSKKGKKATKRLSGEGQDAVDAAIAEGARMVGTVIQEGRKARKKAAKEARQVAEAAEERRQELAKAAEKQAKIAKRELKHTAESAKQHAQRLAENIELGQN